MRIERLEVPFDHCPKCMSECIEGAFFVPRDGFQFEQIECYSCGHNWEIKSRFLADETLFDRITASPEVLAEKLVYLTEDVFGDVTWSSTIVPGWYVGREDCIAATVAKLKEVEK